MADKKKGFDSIFESTAGKKKPAAKAKTPAKKKAAPAIEKVVPAADPGQTLHAAWQMHENEVLYRKAKEDRVLIFSVLTLVAVVFGTAFVLAAGKEWYWISRLIFRLFFCGVAVGFAFAGSALIELNRKRMQDLLSMIVHIQETLGLYEDNTIPGSDGAFFPNTYKFIGSMNDDETNYAQMVLKVATAGAIFVILLLA